MATQAAEAGSAEALVALADAYTPREYHAIGSNLLAQAITPDAQEALTLYYVAHTSLESDSSVDSKILRAGIEKKIDVLTRDLTQISINAANGEAIERQRLWKPMAISNTRRGVVFDPLRPIVNAETALCSKANFIAK